MPRVGAGKGDGAHWVRMVSRGRGGGELQGLKGTWPERRKRSKRLMGGPALAEGAKGPNGSLWLLGRGSHSCVLWLPGAPCLRMWLLCGAEAIGQGRTSAPCPASSRVD